MKNFNELKKLSKVNINVRYNKTKNEIIISNILKRKLIGFLISFFGLLILIKAFIDLALTNGSGLHPTPFHITLIFGIIAFIGGFVISNNPKGFRMKINCSNKSIKIKRNSEKDASVLYFEKNEINRFDIFENENNLVLNLITNTGVFKLFEINKKILTSSPDYKNNLLHEINNNLC